MARRGQFNRIFVVGLAGAAIASVGLFATSLAGGEIRDPARAKLRASSDWVSGRQPIAGVQRDRQPSRTIVSNSEAGNETRNQNGNDLAAKSAFSAGTRGGARLHAIVRARTVGGRSAGGRRAPPRSPPEPTGCNDGKDGEAVGMSDAMAGKSTATSDARVRNQRRRRLPEQLQRNRGSVCSQTPGCAVRRTRNCLCARRVMQ